MAAPITSPPRATQDRSASDPHSQWLQDKTQVTAALSVRAIYVQAAVDELAGVSHFPPRENPDAVAQRLI